MAFYNAKVALLAHTIDYAGTFPPAALSLDGALSRANLFRRQGRHPWLMFRVALNMDDVKKVTPAYLYEKSSDGAPFLITALGTPPKDRSLKETIEWDLREIQRMNERGKWASSFQQIVGYETKLPLENLDDPSIPNLRSWLFNILDPFKKTEGITPALEVPLTGDWLERVTRLCDAAASWIEKEGSAPVPAIKIRTGGDQIPSMEQVAGVLRTVCSRGLRFKATQGLHEAFTHGKSLGFVNLFASLNLLHGLGSDVFNETSLIGCLSEEDRKAFHFGESKFSWKKFEMDVGAVESSRRRHGGCFGSCSLDEPDESLIQAEDL